MNNLTEKPFVKHGLYLGGVTVAYILLLYLVDVSLLISLWNSAISLVLIVVFMVLAAKEQRNLNGGSLSYGEGVLTALGVGVISSILGIIFNHLLYNYIDPSLSEQMRTLTIEKTMSMLESMGASESTIEQTMENMDERQFVQDFRAAVTALMVTTIFSSILALIVAAFVKKEAPLFEEQA
jgi:cellobiose-specific phosphotransferase system component IIC